MSERIDHAAEARNYIACWEEKAGQHPELDMALLQAHATLALVEQQRIANEIAQRYQGTRMFHERGVDWGDVSWDDYQTPNPPLEEQ